MQSTLEQLEQTHARIKELRAKADALQAEVQTAWTGASSVDRRPLCRAAIEALELEATTYPPIRALRRAAAIHAQRVQDDLGKQLQQVEATIRAQLELSPDAHLPLPAKQVNAQWLRLQRQVALIPGRDAYENSATLTEERGAALQVERDLQHWGSLLATEEHRIARLAKDARRAQAVAQHEAVDERTQALHDLDAAVARLLHDPAPPTSTPPSPPSTTRPPRRRKKTPVAFTAPTPHGRHGHAAD
jgi:hypothetical protein